MTGGAPWWPGDPMDNRQGAGTPAPNGGLFSGGMPGSSKGGVNNWGQTLGAIGSIGGLFAGPAGMALGPMGNLAGSWIDAHNANRGLMSQGLMGNVNAVPAAISNGMFGLMGRMGMGASIADQVGGIKNEAAMNDPRFAAPDYTDGTRFTGSSAGGLIGSADKADWGFDSAGLGGGSVGKSGDSLGGDYAGGNYGGSMDKGDSNDRGGVDVYARGGIVRSPARGAHNPPGPDDQYAGVQTGEGVISRANMQAHPELAMLVQRLMQGSR